MILNDSPFRSAVLVLGALALGSSAIHASVALDSSGRGLVAARASAGPAPLRAPRPPVARSTPVASNTPGPRPRSRPAAPLAVLAFTDTASVRIVAHLESTTGAPRSLDAIILGATRGDTLWAGVLGPAAALPGGGMGLQRTIAGLHPRLWDLASPELYRLVVRAGNLADTVRIGFRRFEMRDGRLFLNGRPIFLRGNAINPPGRNIPDSLDESRAFVEDYVRYMKRIGVNLIRLSRTSQVWLDVCDEQGMMAFQGLYGVPRGGSTSRPPDKPFEQVVDDYHQVLDPLANHASVVIYILSNELASRDILHRFTGADSIAAFLRRVRDTMYDWDSSRVYIANAGYGYGRSGDICDVHHYWGWYYNTVLSFYTLRDPATCWRTEARQPITISENTGSYTGPDGAFNILPEKQLSSQLNWTGHAPPAEQPDRALAYQAFVARNAIEITRRTRDRDPYLAGLMPFTTIFSRWWRIHSFADMAPKPVARQFGVSYQPVLLSWELWTPQVYAGTTLRPTAHVVNDDTLGRSLTGLRLNWRLRGPGGAVIDSGAITLGDVAYFDARAYPVAIPLPPTLATGDYTLEGQLLDASGARSHNVATLFVAAARRPEPAPPARRILLYDAAPGTPTAAALRHLGLRFGSVGSLEGLRPTEDALVIGAGAWDETLAAARATLSDFVAAGGRVVVLGQKPERFDPSWIDDGIRPLLDDVDAPGDRRPGNPYRNAMAVNPERPGHPVFAGLDRDRLFLWSDPSGWTEASPGFPAVYPVTAGFMLDSTADLSRTAVLADYGPGLEGIALAEFFRGKGSVLLSGFDLVGHAVADPAAARLLVNLLEYAAGASAHQPHILVTAPIRWGDYGSEAGLALETYGGLLVNTVPVVPAGLDYPVSIDSLGYEYAGGRGGWNSRPAVQYVARGRRPFGPYALDLFSSPRIAAGRGPEGAGGFWCRVPAGRTEMATVVRNPVDVPLALEVTLNGVTRRTVVPPRQTITATAPLRGATDLAVRYRGDRRLVLLETRFR